MTMVNIRVVRMEVRERRMAMEMTADLIRNWSFMNGKAAEPRSAEPRRSLW